MKKLFLGVIACMLSVAGSLIGLGILMGYPLLSIPAKAQPQPPGLTCLDRGKFSGAIREERIANGLVDLDGDEWIIVRNPGTGDWMIGFIQRGNQMAFCMMAKGKMNPES